MFATAELTVADDVSGLTLALQPMLSFKGHVAFDSAALAPPVDLTTLRITLGPPTPSAGMLTLMNGVPVSGANVNVSASPTADGVFEVTGLMPGTYRVTLMVPGATSGKGWWLRSAMVADRDVLDTFLELNTSSGNLNDAVLTLSDRHTDLSGTLQTPTGQPASDCFVIAFSTDRAAWTPQGRRLQTTRPGTDGRFEFWDLPPGEYFLAALTDLDQDEWQDAVFLAQVAAAGAVKVSLSAGEQKIQNLRIGSSPDCR
jgi:hypothetical protein